MSTNDCIKGLAVGGLIGLVVGILYAPKKGKETRKDIAKTAENLLAKAREQYEQAMEEIENLVNQEKESFSEKKTRLKKAIEAGVETFKEEQHGTG